jgi:hypothetical protein
MPIPYHLLNDEQIGSADVIAAVDSQTGGSRSVYGHLNVPMMRPYPAGPYTLKVVEVEIRKEDEALFQELCRRVESVKRLKKAESAKELAKRHYQTEPGLTHVFRFSGAPTVEVGAAEPIKLLEVNRDTMPSGVMPLSFGPAPASGVLFPSVIIEVTPEEFAKIQSNEMKLPQGWEFEEELPKPLEVGGGS